MTFYKFGCIVKEDWRQHMVWDRAEDIAAYTAVGFLGAVVALLVVEFLSPGTGFDVSSVVERILHM
ncbi:MAG: hypothetical protein A3A31_01465 [Candidatus Zambryskibacteria bacterium RIFCSPLOWO2_01_FULL_48_25]|nr:MAG: hypothetical protein A3A31_01465 [Candidatus Zambryskibacteria bacterium RIFCSPLOWO2_01_FULL_48_25]